MSSIRLDHISKVYAAPVGLEDVVAVNDVSLVLASGERLGIIGANGAGKSTLLQIAAGLTDGSSGQRHVDGRVTAVMTLGVGLRDQVSGRENIYLDGELQGKSRRQVDQVMDEIVAFADLGDFIDQPARTYSTGMKARLAFSMLVNIDPEILVIDEALSVGDAAFSRKAASKIREICARGSIVILVSHSMTSVREICNRCIWLDRGRVVMDGPPDAVCDAYLDSVRKADNKEALARFTQSIGGDLSAGGWQAGVALSQGVVDDQRLIEAAERLAIRISGTRPDDRPFTIAVTITRLDGTIMFAHEFAGHECGTPDGRVSLAVIMDRVVLGAAIYRVDVRFARDHAVVAATAAMFEVYASIAMAGGKPMLLYPVTVDVAGPA